MHRLEYWDPVWHIILGFLHNWLEGILQHQLRDLWGVGRKGDTKKDKNKDQDQDDRDEEFTARDLSESAAESEDLVNDLLEWITDDEDEDRPEDEDLPEDEDPPQEESTPQGTPTPDPTLETTPVQDTVPPALPGRHRRHPAQAGQNLDMMDLDDGGDDDQDLDYIPLPTDISKAELKAIRECIRNLPLPTWVSRPPSNLGEKSHGKLKADQYLILFTAILPLILPAIFVKRGDLTLLKSYYDLTACTNIVVSFKTSDSEADQFTKQYTAYRESIQKLYPDTPSKPNHHYAGHNAEILKHWGPLPCLSEFPGERMNGRLQKVPTNRHTYDMDFTMLKQMARLGRLSAFLQNAASSDPRMETFANILERRKDDLVVKPIDSAEQAVYLTEASDLNTAEYNMILQYLNQSGHHGEWRDNTAYPHPEHALVLPPLAKHCIEFMENGRTYSCNSSHEGNSWIQFYDKRIRSHSTGVIQDIVEIPLQGFLRKFIFVLPHQGLAQAEVAGTPYDPIMYPGFKAKLVEVELSEDIVIIEPEHILTHYAGGSIEDAKDIEPLELSPSESPVIVMFFGGRALPGFNTAGNAETALLGLPDPEYDRHPGLPLDFFASLSTSGHVTLWEALH
ncbi:hypothetical protein B0H12DRAFT_1246358 [Mycena haematopus]|nr:hypothetical protein B0H12DRAFT_1246358 [Mycena haematopus]